MSLWAGQGAPLVRYGSARALIDDLLRTADTLLHGQGSETAPSEHRTYPQ